MERRGLIEFGGGGDFLFQVGERSPDERTRANPERLHDFSPVEGQWGAFSLGEFACLVFGQGGLETLKVLYG